MKLYKVGDAELVTGRYLFDDLEDVIVAKAIFDEYREHLDYTFDVYPDVKEKSGAYRYVFAIVLSRNDAKLKDVVKDIDKLLSEGIANWWATISPDILEAQL